MFSKSTGFASEMDLAEPEEGAGEPLRDIEEIEQDVFQEQENIRAEVQVMSEVRTRMHKAKCYEALLQNPLFGPTPHPLAAEVEAEVRDFVMQRLCVFMGMQPESKSSQVEEVFDEEQIGALMMLANRVLKRPLMGGTKRGSHANDPQVHAATIREDVIPLSTPKATQEPPRPSVAPQKRQSPSPPPTKPATKHPSPVAATAEPAVEMVQHPLTGKMVAVSTLKQAKPEGVQPVDQPLSGDFASRANGGGFVDMTGGAAAASAQIGVSHGAVGAGINTATHGQLISYFLNRK